MLLNAIAAVLTQSLDVAEPNMSAGLCVTNTAFPGTGNLTHSKLQEKAAKPTNCASVSLKVIFFPREVRCHEYSLLIAEQLKAACAFTARSFNVPIFLVFLLPQTTRGRLSFSTRTATIPRETCDGLNQGFAKIVIQL